jgi:integrase
MALYRRGKIWWFNFDFQGRHIQESSGFVNKTAALRAEAKRRTDLLDRRAGFTKCKPCPRFEEYAKQFLEWSMQQHRPKTYELHKLNCETLKRFFHGKYLDEISSAMIENFKSARKRERVRWAKNRTLTDASVNRALATAKLLYHQAERSGYTVKNPVVGVAMFREPIDSMCVISFKEQASYLAETSQPLHDIAKIILDTGMRPEEVFRLQTENLDFKQKTIFCPYGKTKAARRAIPMTDDALSLLTLRVKKATKLGTPYLFAARHDVQKPIGSVKKAHAAAVKRANLKRHFRLYDLRHTFATRAVASGVDLPTLSALLGHASIVMSAHYVHPAAEQKRVAMEKFEKFRAEQTIAAATTQQNEGVTTKVTTVELVN